MRQVFIFLGWLMPDSTPFGLTDAQFQALLAREQKKATEWALRQQYQLASISDGMWDVRVRGEVIQVANTRMALPISKGGDWGMAAMNGWLADNDIGFDPNYFASHGGSYRGIAGFGQIGGNKVWLSITALFDTWIHEFRHNLGFGEGNLIHADGTITFYGDGTGVGGRGRDSGFIAPVRKLVGLETAREVITITDDTEFNLAPLELHADGLNDDEYCVGLIHNRAGSFYISIRKTDSIFPHGVNSFLAGKLNIHVIMSGDRHTYRLEEGDIAEGESYEIFSGCTVTHKKYVHDRSVIEVEFEND